jgi:hypothetical protein
LNFFECAIIVVVATVIVLLFLFPPFMCIDAESGGRVHAALGYCPVWNPPSPEIAFRRLYPKTLEAPNPERLAAVLPRINRVRLSTTAFAVAVAGTAVIQALRRRDRRIRTQ